MVVAVVVVAVAVRAAAARAAQRVPDDKVDMTDDDERRRQEGTRPVVDNHQVALKLPDEVRHPVDPPERLPACGWRSQDDSHN